MKTDSANSFDLLYAEHDDPWHIEARWYERRKRAVLMAALPFETVGRIFEPGCGNGALSLHLASRCDTLVASDTAPRALANARLRLESHQNIVFACQTIPEQWPTGRFDCIVLSELAYYLSRANIATLVERLRESIVPLGYLVACHWNAPFPQRTHATDALHELFKTSLELKTLVHHAESDFRLDVWSAEAKSVATRDGLL